MNESRLFSDEELTAYLDGEVDYARINEINQALAQDSALRRRVEELSLSRQSMASAFDELLTMAPVIELEQQINNPSSSWAKPSSAAAIAASLILTFFLGWGGSHYLSSPGYAHWHDYVAAYQALYVTRTLDHIQERKPEVLASELERVSNALGKALDLSVLQQHIPLDYKRSQILGFEGKPLIQMAFLSSMKTPIALCIMRNDNQQQSAIALSTLENMSAASWQKDGFTYLLIGGTDALLIEDMAEQFVRYL